MCIILNYSFKKVCVLITSRLVYFKSILVVYSGKMIKAVTVQMLLDQTAIQSFIFDNNSSSYYYYLRFFLPKYCTQLYLVPFYSIFQKFKKYDLGNYKLTTWISSIRIIGRAISIKTFFRLLLIIAKFPFIWIVLYDEIQQQKHTLLYNYYNA